MFTKENYSKQNTTRNWSVVQGENGEQVQSSLVFIEVENMEPFHRAFFCLKVIRTRALPWDRSVEVIELYLIEQVWFQRNPLQNGYHRYVTQGSFCASFVEYCLHDNDQMI